MWDRKQKTKSESVADALREKILSGFFRDGRLPQKAELNQHFSVSQKTIENAIEFLRNEGLVYGVRGSGLFVSNALPEKVNKKLSVYDKAGHGGNQSPMVVDFERWMNETLDFMEGKI